MSGKISWLNNGNKCEGQTLAAYSRQTCDQKRFTVSELTVDCDWHDMRPVFSLMLLLLFCFVFYSAGFIRQH